MLFRLLAILTLLLASLSTCHAQQKNVLLLISDDQGLDAGCYGSNILKTPNLDKLASEGVRFTHAFTTVASCSPSRAALMSGLYQHTNGMYGLAHATHHQSSLASVRGVPYHLKQAGYRTGLIGKNHVAPKESFPYDTEIGGGRNVFEMSLAARKFFSEGDKPFLLVMGFVDPHRAASGFGNEKSYTGVSPVKYRPEEVVVPYHLPDRPEVRRDLADYYESLSRMDAGVGMALKALDDAGKRDSTLVIFLSDNGIPFPGAKTTLYDAGTHLPLLIRSPNQSKRGVVNNAMTNWVDIAPTIYDWTGVRPQKLPGRSLLPILEQESPSGWDVVFGSHTMHEITMYYPMRSIRTRTHKLIWNLSHGSRFLNAGDLFDSPTWQGILKRGDGKLGARTVRDYEHRPEFELYDLSTDPNELKNRAYQSSHKQILAELKSRLMAMMKETADPWLEVVGR